jgi:hypothetical protein
LTEGIHTRAAVQVQVQVRQVWMTAIQRTRTARRDRDETSVVVWLHRCVMDAQMAISTWRAVDEGIGSVRDSPGPSMRKTYHGQRAKRPYRGGRPRCSCGWIWIRLRRMPSMAVAVAIAADASSAP